MSDGNKSTAVYYRVSTFRQDIENQVKAVSDYCNSQKISPSEVAVFEDVVSGATDLRPNLQRLIDDIKIGLIKRVVVWRLDRLGRSLQHLIKLMELFKKYNVAFVSVQEAIDTSTSAGVLMFHILGSMAQFERDLISERAKLSCLRRKSEGKYVGRVKGSKDIRKRKTDGYKRRYLIKHFEEAKALFNLSKGKTHLQKLQKLGKQLGINPDEVANLNLPL